MLEWKLGIQVISLFSFAWATSLHRKAAVRNQFRLLFGLEENEGLTHQAEEVCYCKQNSSLSLIT